MCGELQDGFADLQEAVGIGGLADDETPGVEVVEGMTRGVYHPLCIIVVVHGGGIDVCLRKDVAAEGEVAMRQLQLS